MSNSRFAVLMAAIVAVVPFALDVYLPAIPDMALALEVSTEQVATTISLFIIGLALGNLVGGPLSDRFGLHIMILLGLSIFALSSVLIAQAESLFLIQVCRLVQAMGGGFATVCVSPLIRQRAAGAEAAKLFALVGFIMVAVPAIAPTIGASLLVLFKWNSIFYLLTFYPLLVMLIILWRLSELFVLPQQNVSQRVSALSRYLQVLKNKKAMRFLLAQSLAFSVMMVFVTNASFIYQQYFKVSEHAFALLFAANIIMMAIINRINSLKLNKHSPLFLFKRALILQLTAVLSMLICIGISPSLNVIAVCVVLTVGAHGAIGPNSNALYMSHFSEHLGSASALIGASQFMLGGLVGGLSTYLFNGTLWPVFLIMLSLSLSANLLLLKVK